MRRLSLALAAAVFAVLPATAQQSRFNWDDLGTEFCRLTLKGDLAAMQPILSRDLARQIEASSANPAMLPARVLFQTYVDPVPVCRARTHNAALIEITRARPGGPAWREYLVVVPEPDGTTRIDDVLFATRRSDTLRARLEILAN